MAKCGCSSSKKAGCAAPAKSMTCAATTKSGTKCKNPVSGKSKFCASHKK